MTFTFRRAVRQQRKARIGIIGPSGSGKTYTALQIATGLAGPGGRIAVIDTENYSSSLYADRFTFDVLPLDTFSPAIYVQAIQAAEAAGYDVLVIDSLSHAWAGKDGALEQVDKAAARTRGNSFAAWREVTPQHNALVDAIVRAKLHVVATMRAKTEYVVDKDERTGKTTPRKVGLAPVQRDGMEYEFDIVADMDHENRFIVSKTRLSDLAGAVIQRPGPELGEQIRNWLMSGVAAAPAAERATTADAQAVMALAAYHAAAAALLPDEEDRIDFLRYGHLVMEMNSWQKQGGTGEPPALRDVGSIPVRSIQSITKRVSELDADTIRELLAGWKAEFGEGDTDA